MTAAEPAALTCDAVLGGRLRLWQPARGFRIGSDAVLLAAATPARAGEAVLDLGCGVGPAMLCVAARTGAWVLGLELQADLAALARRNAAGNGLAAAAVVGDVAAPPFGPAAFDHVVANPPYFPAGRHSAAPQTARRLARSEATPLAQWVAAARLAVRPGGTITFIQRAERLPELLALLPGVAVLPLVARVGQEAKRVIVQWGRTAPGQRPALITHAGQGYAETVEAVLRHGAPLRV